MTTETPAELLAHITQAESNATAQESEAAALQNHIDTLRARLTDAQADRKRAHRKATRPDRPNRHAQGRTELRHIDENVIPKIQAEIDAVQVELDHYTADAARLRAVAAEYRAQHAAATADPVTVATPHAFIDWYADYGTDKITDADADATLTAARHAYRTAAPGERVKISTSDPRILDGLITAADAFIANTRECIDADPDGAGLLRRDIRITEKFADRIRDARTELLAQAQQTAQEAPAAVDTDPAPTATQWSAQEAPTAAPALTSWERETLANADQAPATPREPSADLNIAQGDDPQGPQEADETRVVLFTDHRRCEHRKSVAADHAPTCPVYDEGALNDACTCHYSDALCEEQQATATPVEVEWTHTVHGHHNGTATLDGTTYRITHISHADATRGALGDHLAHLPHTADGRMGALVARTWGLAELLAAIADHAQVPGTLAVTEHGRRLTRR
jgi:hypothetical protein